MCIIELNHRTSCTDPRRPKIGKVHFKNPTSHQSSTVVTVKPEWTDCTTWTNHDTSVAVQIWPVARVSKGKQGRDAAEIGPVFQEGPEVEASPWCLGVGEGGGQWRPKLHLISHSVWVVRVLHWDLRDAKIIGLVDCWSISYFITAVSVKWGLVFYVVGVMG